MTQPTIAVEYDLAPNEVMATVRYTVPADSVIRAEFTVNVLGGTASTTVSDALVYRLSVTDPDREWTMVSDSDGVAVFTATP